LIIDQQRETWRGDVRPGRNSELAGQARSRWNKELEGQGACLAEINGLRRWMGGEKK